MLSVVLFCLATGIRGQCTADDVAANLDAMGYCSSSSSWSAAFGAVMIACNGGGAMSANLNLATSAFDNACLSGSPTDTEMSVPPAVLQPQPVPFQYANCGFGATSEGCPTSIAQTSTTSKLAARLLAHMGIGERDSTLLSASQLQPIGSVSGIQTPEDIDAVTKSLYPNGGFFSTPSEVGVTAPALRLIGRERANAKTNTTSVWVAYHMCREFAQWIEADNNLPYVGGSCVDEAAKGLNNTMWAAGVLIDRKKMEGLDVWVLQTHFARGGKFLRVLVPTLTAYRQIALQQPHTSLPPKPVDVGDIPRLVQKVPLVLSTEVFSPTESPPTFAPFEQALAANLGLDSTLATVVAQHAVSQYVMANDKLTTKTFGSATVSLNSLTTTAPAATNTPKVAVTYPASTKRIRAGLAARSAMQSSNTIDFSAQLFDQRQRIQQYMTPTITVAQGTYSTDAGATQQTAVATQQPTTEQPPTGSDETTILAVSVSLGVVVLGIVIFIAVHFGMMNRDIKKVAAANRFAANSHPSEKALGALASL